MARGGAPFKVNPRFVHSGKKKRTLNVKREQGPTQEKEAAI